MHSNHVCYSILLLFFVLIQPSSSSANPAASSSSAPPGPDGEAANGTEAEKPVFSGPGKNQYEKEIKMMKQVQISSFLIFL